MERRVTSELIGIGTNAHQFPESVDRVVHDNGAKRSEWARITEHIKQGLIGLAHPVGSGTIGDAVDGQPWLAHRSLFRPAANATMVLMRPSHWEGGRENE